MPAGPGGYVALPETAGVVHHSQQACLPDQTEYCINVRCEREVHSHVVRMWLTPIPQGERKSVTAGYYTTPETAGAVRTGQQPCGPNEQPWLLKYIAGVQQIQVPRSQSTVPKTLSNL